MVYEVKNIYDVGFGKTSKRTDMQSFTVNGPLFDIDKKPVWWYIDGENTKKEFIDPTTKPGNFSVDNGIFGVWSDGKPHLISYEEYKKNPIKFKRAFQNGPMLMYNGKDMRETGTSETKYNRSGIWFTPGWDMIVIYSENPVTFKEFTKLTRPIKKIKLR